MPVQRIPNFSLTWLLSVLAGMLLTLAVLAAVLFWRLTEGRMTMHSVTQAMSSALSMPEQGVVVEVGAAQLSWGGWQSPLGVRMFDLDVTTPQGKLKLPEMEIGLNLPRLFRGEVVPSRIRLEQPSLQWTLGQTDVSGIDFSGWLGASAQPSEAVAIPPHLQRLKQITLNNADIRVMDPASGRVIQAVQVNVSAKRTVRDVSVKIDGKVRQEKLSIPVQVEGQWQLQEQSGTGKLTFGAAPWTWATQWLPENEWTPRLDAPISGTVSVEVGGDLQPTRLEGAVSLGAGTLDLGEGEVRRFSGAKLEGVWEAKADTLEVSAFQTTLSSGLDIKASGKLRKLQTTPHGQVEVFAKPVGLVHELNELLKTRMPNLQVSARGPKNEQRIGTLAATVILKPPASLGGFPEIGEVTGTVSLSDVRMGLQHTSYPRVSALVADADGTVEFKLGPELSLQYAEAQFELSDGSVVVGEAEPVEVEKLTFTANWDGSVLQTKNFRIALDNTTRLEAQGKLRMQGSTPAGLSLHATAFNVPVDDLSGLWHPNLATGIREWVVNHMSKGQVREATVALQMSSGESPNVDALQLRHLKSTLHVSDTTVRYYENLPESRGVNATVEIGADAVEIAIHSGVINELNINAGSLRFAPLQSEMPKAQFTFDVTGPLPVALALLEHPDLAVLEDGDLPFSQASGQVRLALGMDFPLKDELAEGDFQFSADARIDNASLLGLPLDLALHQGSLHVTANPRAVLVTGTGRVAGAEVALEFSRPTDAYSSTSITLPTSPQVAALVGQITGFQLEGQASGQVQITQQSQEASLVAVQVGLDPAGFVVPVVGWEKKVDSPGTAKVVALVTEEGFSPLLSVQLETAEFGAQGRLVLDTLGGFRSLQLSGLHGPGTKLDLLEILNHPGEGYTVKLRGPQVDLSPLLEDAEGSPVGGVVEFELSSNQMALSKNLALSGTTRGSVSADGAFHAKHQGGVVYHNRTVLTAGEIEVTKTQKLPHITGRGKSGDGDTRFTFQPQADQPHVLKVESDDAGSVLFLLTDTHAIKGGKLDLRTEFLDDNLTRHKSEVRLSNFTVTEAPLLVNIFSLISLTGLLEQLVGGGVFFDEGYSKVSVNGSRYTFTEGSAIGMSTGVVFSGWLDRAEGKLDLKGSVAPAYVLTRLVSWIPVLGTILTGTDKAGLIALDFRVHGSIDDPDKDTRPLSLAPGILREVFRFDWLDRSRNDSASAEK